MNLHAVSNLFKQLVDASDYWQSYHFGYHSDLHGGSADVYNIAQSTGRMYPLVLWAQPSEGTITKQGNGYIDNITVDLFFYSTQHRANDGTPVNLEETTLSQWHTLKTRAFEFLHSIEDMPARQHDRAKWYAMQPAFKWFSDSHLHIDRLLCIGATITLMLPYNCTQHQIQQPLLSEAVPGAPANEIDLQYV